MDNHCLLVFLWLELLVASLHPAHKSTHAVVTSNKIGHRFEFTECIGKTRNITLLHKVELLPAWAGPSSDILVCVCVCVIVSPYSIVKI